MNVFLFCRIRLMFSRIKNKIRRNQCLVAVASALTYFAPEAAGSGIPHVKSYLNGNRLPGVLKLRVLFVKVRQDVSE